MSTPPSSPGAGDVRPSGGCWLLLVPIFFTLSIVVAYVGMAVLGWFGHPASGDVVAITFTTACDEAEALVRARVDGMGLGDPTYADVPGGFEVTARLPADDKVAAAIPATLARPGRVEIVADSGEVLVRPEQIDTAQLRLGTRGPVVGVQLDRDATRALRSHMEAHPDGRIRVLLDGEAVDDRKNVPAEPRGNVEVIPPGKDETEMLGLAAEWALVIEHGPMPCDVAVAGVRTVEAAP